MALLACMQVMDLKASNERQAQAMRSLQVDVRTARTEVGDCQPYVWCKLLFVPPIHSRIAHLCACSRKELARSTSAPAKCSKGSSLR
jgi:hypothetical protein